MSAISDKYEYDVFFSYAWALEATDDPHFRDWCREVADGIASLLRVRFNTNGRKLEVYLDRDKGKPGQALSEKLKAAAERSAVFVAMVSDYYQTDWCQREQDWFCDQIAADGAALADRVCILRVQATSEGTWPKRFADPGGGPRVYLDFCDKGGQPINLAEFLYKAPTPGLAQPTEQAALDISAKLDAIKLHLLARAAYESSRLPPDSPVLYFEAEPKDQPQWSELVRVLERMPNIVLPAQSPVPADAVTDAEQAYGACDGMVLLRSRPGDNIVPRVKRAYQDLRRINKEHRANGRATVPWVLLDGLDEPPPPDLEPFKIRRVPARGDFAPELQKALFDA